MYTPLDYCTTSTSINVSLCTLECQQESPRVQTLYDVTQLLFSVSIFFGIINGEQMHGWTNVWMYGERLYDPVKILEKQKFDNENSKIWIRKWKNS